MSDKIEALKAAAVDFSKVGLNPITENYYLCECPKYGWIGSSGDINGGPDDEGCYCHVCQDFTEVDEIVTGAEAFNKLLPCVTALLAALEEANSKNYLADMLEWRGKAEAAEKSLVASREVVALYDERLKEAEQRTEAAGRREEHLKATADVLSAKNAELETGHSKAAKQVNSWRNLAKQSIAEREKDIAALDVARQRNSELERRNNYFGDGWRPDVDPITGRPFFMWINHPDLGYVPTYGGPYDSFTLAERDSNGEFSVHRYDHDEGAWVDDECVTAQVVEDWLPSNQSELDEHVKEKTAELQQRLQQPIKLKHEYYSPSLKEANTMELNSNGAFMVALDVTDAIRAAGFKVEGE